MTEQEIVNSQQNVSVVDRVGGGITDFFGSLGNIYGNLKDIETRGKVEDARRDRLENAFFTQEPKRSLTSNTNLLLVGGGVLLVGVFIALVK